MTVPSWLAPPTFPDETRTDRAALVHALSLIVMGVGILYLVLQSTGSVFQPGQGGRAVTLVVIIVPLVTEVLLRRGAVTAAAILFIGFVWTSTTLRFLLTDSVRSSHLFTFANLVIIAGLTLGRRAIWPMFALSLLPLLTHIVVLSSNFSLPSYFNESRESALLEHIFSAGISAFLVYYALGRIEKNLAAVRDSEARHRALISAIPDLIFLNHRDGSFIDVKTRETSLLLIAPEHFLGKKPHEVLPAPLADQFSKAFAGALEDRREHTLEYELPMPDGTHAYEARVVPCTEDTVMTVARDISRRRKQEAQLRTSENQFHTLFQNAPIGISVTDLEGKLLAFNEAMLMPGGYSREEFERLGSVEALYIDPRERAESLELFRSQGVLRGRNVRFRRKDGTPYEVLVSLSHTVFDGRPAIQKIVEDLTEHRRDETLREAVFHIAEAATEASRLDQLYPAVHEIIGGVMPARNFYIALYDEERHLLSFPYFVDERDVPSEPHAPGRGLTEYVLRSGQSLLCDAIKNKELMERGEADLVGVDAPIWLGVPLVVDRKTIGVMAVQHYSDPKAYGEREQRMLEYVSSQVAKAIEQKMREQEILKLNADLERRVRERTAELTAANQELESFVYTISHDLRAPLRGVGGFAALLQREHSEHLSTEARSYVQRIADGTRRMGALIDDLLAFAHISRKDVRREIVRPAEIVQQVIEELHPAIRASRANIVVDDLPEVSADPALLRQVFTNLLSNAVKYSSKSPAPVIEVRSGFADGTTVFSVRDNGVGFDMKYAHKLFGVFQRLHAIDEFEGTGVGLAIVHRIITRHGGAVWVDAAEGRGATFSFTLDAPVGGTPGPSQSLNRS